MISNSEQIIERLSKLAEGEWLSSTKLKESIISTTSSSTLTRRFDPLLKRMAKGGYIKRKRMKAIRTTKTGNPMVYEMYYYKLGELNESCQ